MKEMRKPWLDDLKCRESLTMKYIELYKLQKKFGERDDRPCSIEITISECGKTGRIMGGC
jgi:hypothetical protein